MRKRRAEYVQVVPFVAVPPGARALFTYQVPSGMEVPGGALVRVPFGKRLVEGIVWHTRTRRLAGAKNVHEVIGGPLLFPADRLWLRELVELSLESLPLIVKAFAAVRRPAGGTAPAEKSLHTGEELGRKQGFATPFQVTVAWTDRVTDAFPAASDGQVLVLAPEQRIAERIGDQLRQVGTPVRFFSQGLRVRERRALLEALCLGESAVVVATHSGIFLPLPRLVAILVAEAALPAHRQWDLHPRYDARVGAFLRARAAGIPVTYTSSLPSLDLTETAAHTTIRGTPATTLRARILPRRDSPAHILPEAEVALKYVLDAGKTALVFQNVVGAEQRYVCGSCGYTARCAQCGGILQLVERHLACSVCGTRAGPVRAFCPRCGSPKVQSRRIGTAALVEILGRVFPKVPVVRLDRESVSRKAPVVLPHQPAVVIGTERAFAVPFPELFAVSVVLDGDALLSAPQADAGEQALRLIARIAGCTQPPHAETLFVQTRMPAFPLFSALGKGMVAAWLSAEREERQTLSFPPYASQVQFTRLFSRRATAEREARTLVRQLRRRKSLEVGWKVAEVRTHVRVDVLVRGSRQHLWRLLKTVPRTWSADPFVPLLELVV